MDKSKWSIGRCVHQPCAMTMTMPCGAGLRICWLHALVWGIAHLTLALTLLACGARAEVGAGDSPQVRPCTPAEQYTADVTCRSLLPGASCGPLTVEGACGEPGAHCTSCTAPCGQNTSPGCAQ